MKRQSDSNPFFRLANRILNPHVTLRAKTIPDRRKEEARRLARRKVKDDD